MKFTHRDFPIPHREPFTPTTLVRDTYTKDRDSIESAKDVEEHLRKWAPLWKLEIAIPETQDITLFDLNFEEVFSLISSKDKQSFFSKMDRTKEEHAACEIILPMTMVRISILAREYCVPEDIVWDQLFPPENDEDGGDQQPPSPANPAAASLDTRFASV